MPKIAVLGLGWWGAKLARNLAGHPAVRAESLIGVDPIEARRTEAERALSIEVVEDERYIYDRKDVSAVVVATPPPTHFALAKAAFEAGKHVLVTKPPASALEELEVLIRGADERGLVFMMDSTFVYSDPVREVRRLLDSGAVPDIRFVQSLRYGNDLRLHHVGRLKGTMLANGVDVVRDLVFHDLAMLSFLFPGLAMRPVGVHRVNTLAKYTPAEFAGEMCDTAFIRLETDRFPIHIGLSWVLPERRREILVAGPDVQLVYDDLKPERKISLFRIEDKREEFVEHGLREPLGLVVDHFVDCVTNGREPMTGGRYMRNVMRSYEAILTFRGGSFE